MAQVTGIAFITVAGQLLRTKPGAKLMTGGKERTAIVGHSVYGYAEKVVPSGIEATLAHTADLDTQALNDLTKATVIFETDTGASWLVPNCFTTKPLELTDGEGDLAFEMAGEPARPQ